MSWVSCCCGLNPSAAAPVATSSVESRMEENFQLRCRGILLSILETLTSGIETGRKRFGKRASPSVSAEQPGLFGILHRHHFDLDQEAWIGERGDADDGARRQIRLVTAEKLGVTFHEGLEVHRR